MSTSDKLALIGIVIAIVAIIIPIFQGKKYKTSLPTEAELVVVNNLIDTILKMNFSLTYYDNNLKHKARRAFCLLGNFVSLADNVEKEIDKNVIEYPLLVSKDLVDGNYFKEFSGNRYLGKKLRTALVNFKFIYGDKTYTSNQLIESNFGFALLDQNNPVTIFLSIGAIPYRRLSIREGIYYKLVFDNRQMLAKDFKKSLDLIDKELKKWLKEIGKLHMYEKKKSTFIPNKQLYDTLRELRNSIDKNISLDIFGVNSNSPIAKEIEQLMKNGS